MKHIVSVEVVELTVQGIKSWHCRCTSCGWKSTGKTKEQQAVQAAHAHGAVCINQPLKGAKP